MAANSPYRPLPSTPTALITSFLTTPWTPANLVRLQYHLHPSFEWYERPSDVKPIFGPVEFRNRLEKMWKDDGVTDLQVKILSIAQVPDLDGKLEFRGVKVVLVERLDLMKVEGRTIQVKAMGAFEVQIGTGKIGLWRDYWDPKQVKDELKSTL